MSNEEDFLSNKLKNINIKNETYINILLLGSTGVGKSTFINSIANYLTFDKLDMAKKEDKPMTLICSQFTIMDKHQKQHTVKIGDVDQNEYLETGESATQDVKSYVFPIWNGNVNVRLIDTPGIGDTRGTQKDDENSENILSYIGQLKELHAICFLMKPNESRSTVYFKYCMSQILSRLDKSASQNIIFVFTNTKGTDYGPGETVAILKKIIDEIQQKPPYCTIPMNRNIFCFENEPFKYLAALKQAGIEFDRTYVKTVETSWKTSSEQCWKLIKYIVGDKNHSPLEPHLVQSTTAINEARRMIGYLSKPLAEITQLINQNVRLLDRHKQHLDVDKMSVEELKKNLYMPVANLEVIKLTQPVTVCTSSNCAEVYKVGDKSNWHYKQRCHDPCYLNGVPKEIIGCPELVHCAAMSNKQCTKCACSFSIHMHVYYLTKVKEDRQIDENVQKNIHTKEKVMEKAQKIIRNIAKKKMELDDEHRIIVNCCAKFAHFLQNNAITPYNDAYREYIKYLIEREKSMGYLCDMETMYHLQTLLAEYEERKKAFDDALETNRKLKLDRCIISAEEIQDSIKKLYTLKHNGKKIKELYDCQIKSRTKEYENKEYVHKKKFQKQPQHQQQQQSGRQINRGRHQQSTTNHNNNYRDGSNYNRRSRNSQPPSYEESAAAPPPLMSTPYYYPPQIQHPTQGGGGPYGSSSTYMPPPPPMNSYAAPPAPADNNRRGGRGEDVAYRNNDLNISISVDRRNQQQEHPAPSSSSSHHYNAHTSPGYQQQPGGHIPPPTAAHPGYYPAPPAPAPPTASYPGYYPYPPAGAGYYPYPAASAAPPPGQYYGGAPAAPGAYPPYHNAGSYHHQAGYQGPHQQQHQHGGRGGSYNNHGNQQRGRGFNRRTMVRERQPKHRSNRQQQSGNDSDDSQASSVY